MAIPKQQDFMLPVLRIAGDGNEHSNQELYETLAQQFGLTEADLMERIGSDRDYLFNNRVRFACTDLRKAQLIFSPEIGKFRITERGRNILKENPSHIDRKYLKRFPEYLDNGRKKA
jgi:restriction system protein